MFDFLNWVRPDWHPSEDDLLLYGDGELRPREAGRVRGHLEHCWPCRVRAEKNEQMISRVVDYLNLDFAPNLPPPPGSWQRFAPVLQRTATAFGKQTKILRVLTPAARSLSSPHAIHQLATGLAVLLVLFLLFVTRLEMVPRVSASQVLNNAVTSQSETLRKVSQPVVYQKLRIRTGDALLTREIWHDTVNHRFKEEWGTPNRNPGEDRKPARGSAPVEIRDLQTVFAANHLDWDDPLSATSYTRWRDGLQGKVEQASRQGDQLIVKTTATYSTQTEISSSTEAGKIVEATLKLRATDYHLISENLQIQSSTGTGDSLREVELTELNYEVVPLAVVGSTLFEPIPTEVLTKAVDAAPITTPKPAGPSIVELNDDEVAARYVLHEADADLGAPISVEIAGQPTYSSVVVQGLVPSEQLKQELMAALEGIPHVAANIDTEEQVAMPDGLLETGPAISVPVKMPSPIDKQLLEHFGSSGAVEEFSKRVFVLTDALMDHAWAIRRLEERYPGFESNANLPLSAASQELLKIMLRDHRSAMREKAAGLSDLLRPVLLAIAEAPPDTPPAQSLFVAAKQTEQLTLLLLFGSEPAGSSPASPPSRACSELLKALRDLELQLQDQP
jgi:hypothetical protein